MEKDKRLKQIVKLLACVCCVCALFAVLFSSRSSYSAVVTINVPAGSEVSVYVSGDGVKRNDDGSFSAPSGTKVSVTVVNGTKLFSSMTIDREKYKVPVVRELPVSASGSIDISVETTEPYAENKGEYFGSPFLISREADILALERIFEGAGTVSDFARFGKDYENTDAFRYGYYRLTTNIFINAEEFAGLGSRAAGGMPFQGCIDFAGYAVTLSLVRTGHDSEEFVYVPEEQLSIADYGFFSIIYGSDNKPCLVKNANIQGYIAINTVSAPAESIPEKTRINIGGLAGTTGKYVIYDGIESQVSVSARVQKASAYIGGMFGICSSDIEKWCKAVYDGEHNNVSGVTYGEKASVYAGCFCGVLQNAYADNVVIEGEAAMVLSNSLGGVAGSAISGGFAGVVTVRESSLPEFSAPKSIFIRDVNIIVRGEYAVHSVIANDKSTDKNLIDPEKPEQYSSTAVSGGFCGTIYRQSNLSDESIRISVAGIRFVQSEVKEEEAGRIQMKAQTQDGFSAGSVFAGGAIGYVFTDGIKYISHGFDEENLSDERGTYIFECPVDISAVQNGIGPAFAGGVFGYNSFSLDAPENVTVKFHITAHEYDFTVTAVQSASSSKVLSGTGTGGTPVTYPVCAGGYTSVLQPGYTVSNIEFSVKNGTIRAYREVGSTAIGDICAGGYAGAALSYQGIIHDVMSYNGTMAGSVNNLKVTYSSQTLIEAACYSFDSIDTRPKEVGGNNVCAGGAIGFVAGLNFLNGVVVEWNEKNNIRSDSDYFLYGVQNGAFPKGYNNDLKCEGYVGGAIGLAVDTKISNVSVKGDPSSKNVIYFESTNNPDTASVGGVIGALWRITTQNLELLSGASVSDMHVAGKAYNNLDNSKVTYDIYVGGGIGVFANPNGWARNGSAYVKNISVKDCVIESIGEDQMATFAAGIVAGIWWSSTSYLQNCEVSGSSIVASSVSGKTYAGGVNGLVQRGEITGCAVTSTDVRSISVNNEASAAGVFAWAKDGWTVSGNVSNATLHASGAKGSYSGGIGHVPYSKPAGNSVAMYNNYDVTENAGVELIYRNENVYKGYYSGAALNLISYGVNEYTIPSAGESVNVYPGVTSADTILSVKSSDETVAGVSANSEGVTVTGVSAGVSYISVYATLNGKEYLLCSYPVTVESASSENFYLELTDGGGQKLSDSKTDGYAEVYYGTKSKYVYFRHEAGNPNTADVLKIRSGGVKYFPCKARLYDVKVSDYAEGTSAEDRVSLILAAKSDVAQISSFNGRALISFDGDVGAHELCTVSSTSTLKESVVIVIEYEYEGFTHGVIAEFVPNVITGITIAPDEGTPPLDYYVADDGTRHYVYVRNDTVRFSETLEYKYDAKRSYIVETSYSGTGVATNGTVVLSGDGPYEVTCTVLGSNIKDTVYLDVKEERSFSFELEGADVTSDRKMIAGADFSFSASPQPGYGLSPRVYVKIDQTVSEGVWNDDGTISFEFENVKYVGTVTESARIGNSYVFVIPSGLVDYANGYGVTISIVYDKTYSLVFLTNFGYYEFFKTTVRADEKYSDIVIDGLSEWIESIKSQRFGFDFAGFYQVMHASDLNSYGRSFEDLCSGGTYSVSGTARFYARWTYNIVAEAPEGVEVRSSFSETMLDDGYIVPADDKGGFGFVINVPESFCGTPRCSAYIENRDGTYTDISEKFVPGDLKNSYVVSAADLGAYDSGSIYLVVYADSMEFYTGDEVRHEETELYSDGVFTAVYNVNYGANDSPSEATFDFGGTNLPENTSLRLYYRKNSVTVWSGGYVLSSATDKIYVTSFVSNKDGGALGSELRRGAVSEEFILVVTLPLNTDGFGITDSLLCGVSVNAYKYGAVKKTYGDHAVNVTSAPYSEPISARCDFTVYKADIYTVTRNATGSLYYTHTGLKEGLVDRRRGGDSYMWKIEVTGGGAIGDKVFTAFGTETVRTTIAVYYLATAGERVSTYGLEGYTVSLTEVKNVQQPAHGYILFTVDVK